MVDSTTKGAEPTNGTDKASVKTTNGAAKIESAEERAIVMKHYEAARKELKDLIARKKQADKDLATLESQIYRLEGNYLEDTQQGGNIVRGFDGYIKGLVNNRKSTFAETDRLFSLSSVSYSEAATSVTNGSSIDRIQANNKKKRRQTLEESDSDDSMNHYSGNTKRARTTYAD